MNPPAPFPIDALLNLLRCPACRGDLSHIAGKLECACGRAYPIVQGIPILIHEENSLFSIDSFVRREETFFRKQSWIRRAVYSCVPSMSVNRVAAGNYARLASMLLEMTSKPVVLVLGGSVLGAGMEEFHADPRIQFIDTDISFGPLTKVLCDGHDLPFADGSVDCVIAQAVLEHVVEPQRCVEEIHRVLKADGLVYAETPFLQPAHSTPYDFQRWTFIGYRRLFRRFGQLACGPVGGPAQSLGHIYENMLFCLSSARPIRALSLVFARWTAFWWKYLDRIFNRNPHAIHCAFGLYFMGRRSERTLSDREILDQCRNM